MVYSAKKTELNYFESMRVNVWTDLVLSPEYMELRVSMVVIHRIILPGIISHGIRKDIHEINTNSEEGM